ncbi:MAG: hypothetical protein C0594_13280 [Marinilabiliales bacterium]|nr:MAG: hypothetical protein C0594_13280 [Marinilabiliales bacterium]
MNGTSAIKVIKWNFISVLFLLAFGSGVCAQNDTISSAVQSITRDELFKHINYLADDDLKGRDTGERGQRVAALYIAGEFRKSNLERAFGDKEVEGYFQRFTMVNRDFGFFYAMSRKKYRTNYSGIIYKGASGTSTKQWVETNPVFIGSTGNPDYSKCNKEAALLVTEGNRSLNAMIDSLGELTKVRLLFIAVNDKKLFTELEANYWSLERFQLESDYKKLLDHNVLLRDYFSFRNDSISLVLLSQKVTKDLIGFKTKDLLKKAKKSENLGEQIAEDSIWSYYKGMDTLKVKLTENVGTIVKGTEFPDELVVITAHYDHIGWRDTSNYNDSVVIYNGADDNASGTSALIEIAKAFQYLADQGIRPKRSVLFLPVTAEETGLNGSRYYVQNPLYPMDSTAMVINMDMIGRRGYLMRKGKKKVYAAAFQSLEKKSKDLNKKYDKKNKDIIVDYRPGLIRKLLWKKGSDQYSFTKKCVPAIAYFTGLHKDYHKSTDTAEKIDYDKLLDITRHVFLVAWEVANNTEDFPINRE